MPSPTEWPEDALKARFGDDEIEWVKIAGYPRDKPTRYLWGPYIKEPAARQRLDETVGPDAWEMQISFPAAPPPVVVAKCILIVHWQGDSIIREGIGEARDEDEKYKSAATDAFKRAVRLFGIGSYLNVEIGRLWINKGDEDPTGHGPKARQAPPSKAPPKAKPPEEKASESEAPAGKGPWDCKACGRAKAIPVKHTTCPVCGAARE